MQNEEKPEASLQGSYKQWPVSGLLAKQASVFWHYSATESAASVIVPDNCSDLIFSYDDSDRLAYLSAPQSTYKTSHNKKIFALRLHATGLAQLTKTPVFHWQNQHIDAQHVMSNLPITVIFDALAAGKFNLAQRVVSVAVFHTVNDLNRTIHPAVQQCRAILAVEPNTKVESLEAYTHHSRQYLTRLFKQQVGIPLKQFQRIERLQQAINQPNHADALFYDQSHKIREFKALTGQLPGDVLSSH